jgi:hypothetical protein
MHEYRHIQLAEFSQKLPAHATRAAKLVHIGCDSDGLNAAQAMAQDYGRAHGDALGTCSDGVGSIFDVRARYDSGRGFEEYGAADAEQGVGTCGMVISRYVGSLEKITYNMLFRALQGILS